MSKLAKKIVKAVEREIHSRKGIGWSDLDSSIQKEIRASLEEAVEAVLDKASSEEFTSAN
jgi:hypothetical protein